MVFELPLVPVQESGFEFLLEPANNSDSDLSHFLTFVSLPAYIQPAQWDKCGV